MTACYIIDKSLYTSLEIFVYKAFVKQRETLNVKCKYRVRPVDYYYYTAVQLHYCTNSRATGTC